VLAAGGSTPNLGGRQYLPAGSNAATRSKNSRSPAGPQLFMILEVEK